MLLGTLTLGANQAPQFCLPTDGVTHFGHHVSGRYSGAWATLANSDTRVLYLPHRDKEISVTWHDASEGCYDADRFDDLMHDLSELDAAYEGATQREKYQQLLTKYQYLFNMQMVLNTNSNHSSFSLLSFGEAPLSFVGVYDEQLKSSHLVWSSVHDADGLVHLLRQWYPLKFLYYRFPVLQDGALFIPTQATCAHWHKYLKTRDPLFAFNALELKLFR